MLTAACRRGVEILLDDYVEAALGDPVVLAYSPDSREPAAWVRVELEARGIDPIVVPMRPLVDESFEDRFRAAMATVPPARPVKVITFEANTMSHGAAIRRVLDVLGPDDVRVWRAINAGPDLFDQGLQHGPSELAALNSGLLRKVGVARTLEITAPSGTELTVELDGRFRWINNAGTWRPGSFVILPAGEVATYPGSVSGRHVADFAVHVNVLTDIDTRLGASPVTVEVERSHVTAIHCADAGLGDLLDRWFSLPNACRVGELGLGTNPGVTSAVAANSHVNERVRGVHLGFGQHNQPRDLVEYECDIHIDLIAAGGQLMVNRNGFVDLLKAPLGDSAIYVDFDVEDVLSLEDNGGG